MLSEQWRAWREANPATAKRLLRTSALTVLIGLLVLMIFYPHGLYLLGVTVAILAVIFLLYADWRQ
jgi:uncharacterized membrane protein